MNRLLLALLLLNLGGCAAMSEAECRTGDWYGAGERDGQAGRANRIGDYAEACQKAGIVPNANDYARGRERGLLNYCTPENGYRVGRAGESYGNVCAPELQAGFLRAYHHGYERYEVKRDLDEAARKVEKLSRDIGELDDKIKKAANDDERRNLQRQRDDAERDRRDARAKLIVLQTRWSVISD